MRRYVQRLLPMLAPDRLGGQTVMAFGLKIWGAAASFALSWLIAHSYGAAGSGHFGIAVTTVTILSYFVLAGLDYTVIRVAAGDLREGKYAEARGVVFAGARAVAIVGPVVIGVLWLLRERLANDVLHQPTMVGMLGIMLWAVVPLALQRVASAALRASNRVLWSQLIDGPIGTTLAMLGLALAVLTGHATSLRLPAWLYVAGLTLGCVAGWITFTRASKDWPRAIRASSLPLMLAGLPILASNLSNVFTEWYTTVSLGIHWSAVVVGQYRVAWQFVALAGLVQVATDTIIGPRIAAAARVGAKDEIASIARKSLILSLGLASPLFLVLIFAPQTVLSIFGPEFAGGATALRILAVGQLFRLASGPLGSILVMTGNQRWVLAYAVFGIVPCVILVALLVPTYGAIGAAIATGLTVVIRNMAAAVVVHRVLGIKLLSRKRA
ncbi:lipopolysaccharide biosynthesis protein [Glacieibacterium sp.]|uniref:lipopolysaccharide biosynthesis protein n=1 Tax=Glacieibacterium sp. TaxID=2860237 RepID=UPI003AFF66AB